MSPASASRAGVTPEASGDPSSRTLGQKNMSSRDDSNQSDEAGFGGWMLSFVLGVIALPFVAWYILALIFGVARQDSSSVWGLAGLGPLIVVITLSPVYFISQIIAFLLLRRRATKAATILYSAIIGVFFGVTASCLYWQGNHLGRILQSH